MKNQLQKLYDAVKNLSQSGYTAESWQAFQAARDAAKAVLDNPDATQEEVSAAYSDLYTAWQNLKSVQQPGSGDAQNPDGTKPADNGKTGDSAPIIPLTAAAAAAAAAIALVFRRRRTMK